MNIKTFIAAAVVALTAACAQEAPKTETVEVSADENQSAEVQLNDDGSVKTEVVDGSETLVAPVGQPQ